MAALMILILADAPGMEPVVNHPLGPEIISEFENLLQQLDLHYIKRVGWDRVKMILTLATLEAADTDKGARAFDLALSKWRVSRYYDGAD